MERFLRKLIAVFISIGLAVSVQASVIVSDSSEFRAIAKGNYFQANAGLKGSADVSSTMTAGKNQYKATLTMNLFSGNMFSIFQDVTDLSFVNASVKDLSLTKGSLLANETLANEALANEAPGFEKERINFNLDAAIVAENLLDRVKINTRVPESTSIVLFTVGLFSLVMARRKIKA